MPDYLLAITSEEQRLRQLARRIVQRQSRGLSIDQKFIDEIAQLKAHIAELRRISAA